MGIKPKYLIPGFKIWGILQSWQQNYLATRDLALKLKIS
jgi:hypothetical protein